MKFIALLFVLFSASAFSYFNDYEFCSTKAQQSYLSKLKTIDFDYLEKSEKCSFLGQDKPQEICFKNLDLMTAKAQKNAQDEYEKAMKYCKSQLLREL